VAGFYPGLGRIGTARRGNRQAICHVYTHAVRPAWRLAAAAVLVMGAVLSGPALLSGQRGRSGGAAVPPDGVVVGPGGGGPGRILRGRGELPPGTAVIRGRVTTDAGAPVRRAQVRANVGGMPGGRVVSTDVDGRFELRDLPAGQYTLAASKPGFVTQRLGQRRPFETVPPVQIAEGQRVDSANFALLRGGVINGRVQDDLGDPVAHVRVRVQRSQMFEGRRRLINVGSDDETDDTGAFRLYGLPPGEYYVSATLRANPLESSNEPSGFAPTYYPGTGNVAEAQRVSVAAGEEQTVGFSLLPVRLVRISGTVVSSTGEPAGGAVMLASANDMGLEGFATMGGGIQPNGAFAIFNVAPGSYILNARSGFGNARRNGESEIGSVPIVVGDSDLTGVTITLSRGASISGTVVTEGTSSITLTNLRVAARQLRNAMGQPGGNSQVTAGGGFQLSGLSGAVALRVDNLPAQWAIKSIVVGNTEVTDGGFELRGTEQLTNARIVLTDRVSEINGTATAGNQDAKSYVVIAFADDPALWNFPTRYVRSARPDAQGRFTLRGLPGGTAYLLAAVDYVEDGEWQDPELLERLRESASRLAIKDGDTRTVSLKLIER
jgi:hypothetical protein